MKDKHKIFIIALLLSLICSLGAVAASEDIAFEQSMNEEDVEASNQNIKEINMKISSKENEALNSPLNVNGTTFDNISKTISDAHEGDTIFLDGKTYTGNGSAIFINKNITLIGGSDLNDTKYATLDAKFLSNIIVASSPVTIKGIIFINGNSTMGGAINADGDFITIENCTFKNNHVYRDYNLYYGYGYGGAVNLGGKNGAISDCTFINNTAEYGGAIYLSGDLYTIYDSTFINNSAFDGGAIYVTGANVRIGKSKFRNNYAQNGGAINGYGNSVFISKSVFENNNADNGGAIAGSLDNSNITMCNFTNNYASDGGALTLHGSNQHIFNCIFKDNMAHYSGGALIFGGSDATINNCSFINNFINPDYEYSRGGGAILTWGTNLNIYESTFTQNRAEIGSVILNGYQDSHFYNCKFIDNQANLYSLEGYVGLDSWYEDRNAIVELYFISSDNPALKGFAVAPEYGEITLDNATFIEKGKTTIISSEITSRPAEGKVSIYLNGTEIFSQPNIVNGTVTVPLRDISPGIYNITVVVENENGTYIIEKKGDSIPPIAPDMKFIIPEGMAEGETVEFIIILPAKATGNVTLTVNNQKYVHNITPGESIIIPVSNLTIGTYYVDAYYSGDDYYWTDWDYGYITINSIGIRANITDITIVLPANTTGNITVILDNQTVYNNTIHNNTIVIPYNITPGNHNITVIVDDENGNQTVESKIVDVTKGNPGMVVDVPKYASEGETVIIKVTLPEDAKGNITVLVDNDRKIIQNITGNETIIEIKNLTVGVHQFDFTYSGDEKYESTSTKKTTNILVVPIGTEIIVETEFKRVATDYNAGERGEFFYAYLKDKDGNPLVNKTVQIAINGPIYNVKTDSEGKAGLQINMASANTYTYALFFQGDEKYNASLLASSKLIVTKKPMYISASNQVFKTTAKTKTVTVTLSTSKNKDGKMYLNSGKQVTLTVNGKTYTAKSDANGIVKFNIGGLTKKGTYSAVIKFAGDRTYETASKTIKITLNDKGAATTTKAEKTTSAVLSSSNNNANVKTGAIPTSNVVPTKKNTYIEVDANFTRAATDYNAGERGAFFYATLKDSDGNPLANKTVQIAVNGPIYNVTTNEKGQAGLQVNLASANTYTYALSFSGDSEYNAAALACSKLVVTKKPITISAKDQTFKATAKTKTVTATLLTSKNPYDGKTYLSPKKVTLKVDGKTYTGTINSAGKVNFNIQLTKKGTYSATISFDGDKTYDTASKTIKIKIN